MVHFIAYLFHCISVILVGCSLLERLCRLLRELLDETPESSDHSTTLIVLNSLVELAYNDVIKQWIGQNFLRDIVMLLQVRAQTKISDAKLYPHFTRLLRVCTCGNTVVQRDFAAMMFNILSETSAYSPFISKMVSLLLTLNDTIPIIIQQDTEIPLVIKCRTPL